MPARSLLSSVFITCHVHTTATAMATVPMVTVTAMAIGLDHNVMCCSVALRTAQDKELAQKVMTRCRTE